MKINHIGYLVKDINIAIENFKMLGFVTNKKGIVLDKTRDVNICFMHNDGYCVELVMPMSKDSVAYALLKKQGKGPYHICYEVIDIISAEKQFRKKGYLPITGKEQAIAFEGRKVLFLINKSIGMIELVEE